MTAFNVVKFQTKAGSEKEFEEQYRKLPREFEGLRRVVLVNTGPQAYCGIGEWDSLEHMKAARSLMIGNLDKFRHTLQEHGGEVGITDAISGEMIYENAPIKGNEGSRQPTGTSSLSN